MSIWSQHLIQISWTVVTKTHLPETQITFDMARESVSFFQERFAEFVPHTRVLEGDPYIVEQRLVSWKTLQQTEISHLSWEQLESFLAFIDRCIYILFTEWKFFDVTWFQEDNPFEVIQWENIVSKVLRHYKIVSNFFTSTNFIIWDDKRVYFIDTVWGYGVYEDKKNSYIDIMYRLFILFWYRIQIVQQIQKVFEKRLTQTWV